VGWFFGSIEHGEAERAELPHDKESGHILYDKKQNTKKRKYKIKYILHEM
jgi:hypothetical protein